MTGATRQNIFRLKRSNLSGKVPTISQLLVGEMAVNTQDGFLYTSIADTGGTTTVEIRQIGWDRLSTISGGTVDGPVIFNSGITVYNNFTYPSGATTGYVLTSDSFGNASWQPSSGGGSGSTYSQTDNYTAGVPVTINHNLNTTAVLVQIIDTDTNELIDGFISNYTLNSVDVTLNSNINNIKVVVAGGLFFAPVSDYYVTGGTYDSNTGILTLNRQNGSIVITGFTSGSSFGVDTYVTGFTYNDANLLTISQNQGQQDLSINIDTMTGLTVNGILSATTYYGDGSNLTGIVDNYVTGGTYSNGTLTLNRQNGSVVITGFTTGFTNNDTYVTGFTYNNTNRLTISQNNGQTDLNINIDVVTGLTVNGDVTFNEGNILNPNYLQFNTGYTGNTIVEGRMYWDEPNGTVSLGMHGSQVLQQIGLEYFYYVKNQSGVTIQNGRVVKAAGTLGASGRILAEYMIADGSIPSKFTLGVTTEDIVDGEDGYVTEFGLVRGLDTTGVPYGETWSDGDILWVSPTMPGGLTNIEPQTPNLHIEMAIVVYANANGSIFVRPHRYPYSYDLQDFGWSGGTQNNFDVPQWDSSLGYFKLTNRPTFNSISAETYYGTTFSGGTFYGDGSNLTGINDFYVTGGTYSNGTLTLNRQNGSVIINGLLSADTYVTGFTFSNSTYDLTIQQNQGKSDLTVNLGLLASDVNVTGGTYNSNTGVVTFYNNSGGSFTVSGFLTGYTDTIITALTYVPNQISVTSSNGSVYSATINNFTGLTVNGSLSATTYLGLPIDPDNYVTGGTFNNNVLTLDRQNGSVIITGFTDYYVTGFTYNNANQLIISQNNGQTDLSVTINTVTGLTVNGNLIITGTTISNVISASTYQNLPSQYKSFILTGGTLYTFTDFKIINTLSVNKTIGSPTTVVLDQTPNVNDFFVVKDRKGDSVNNSITVSGGTYTIDGNTTVVIKQNNKPSLTFLFVGDEYIII